MCCSNFLYWWKFHQYSILKTLAYCCRIKRRTFWGDLAPQELKNGSCVGSNFRPGRKWTPRELRIYNLVGANFWTFDQWASRELRIFNLVGANFRTGRKWAPRKLRILHFVGQSFWLGLFSKVSADSHFGVKWNWPDALTPYPPVLWVCVFRMPDQCCSCEYLRHYFSSFHRNPPDC